MTCSNAARTRVFAILSAFTFAFVLALPGMARAATCKPQMLLTSLTTIKSSSGRILVPATFGKTQKYLLLDTGGFFGTISAAFAKQQGYGLSHAGVAQLDVTGKMTNQIARVPEFHLGNISADGMDFIVASDARNFGEDNADVVGILSPNFLQNYDIEIDPAHNKVNVLSPDHCKGKVIYWPATAVAAIPFQLTDDGQIYFNIKLDGHEYLTLLDTGSVQTSITIPYAESDFGLKLGSDDAPAAGFLNGDKGLAVYKHKFKSIAFEGIAVSNPTIMIMPDMNAHRMSQQRVRLGSRLPTQDAPVISHMILGNDVLSKLHVYIAYKEKMLYITP